MKIEFIKETMPDGSVRWFTEKDGRYVDDSVSRSEPTAKKMFDAIVSGMCDKKEVIESVTL